MDEPRELRAVVVDDDVVTNVIIVYEVPEDMGDRVIVIPDDSLVGIGWSYDGTEFKEPLPEPEPK